MDTHMRGHLDHLDLCFAAVRNARTIYAMRFLIGLAEAPFYIGVMTLLGNWYTPKGMLPTTSMVKIN